MPPPLWRRPPPSLRPWVSVYTGYRMEAGSPGVHHGAASGHLTLLFCLEGRIEILPDSAHSGPGDRFTAMVGGLHDRPARIATGEAQAGLQLNLTWQGARALLGIPAAEVAGHSVALDAVIGRRAERLLDQLATAADWSARFAVLDRELTALTAGGHGTEGAAPEVRRASDLIRATGGTVRVAELADEVGWSRRHLADRFRVETGLGPKAMARVVRFERVCDRLRHPERPALATVAAEAGYVDQAHMARDFRELAGHTATSWLAERE